LDNNIFQQKSYKKSYIYYDCTRKKNVQPLQKFLLILNIGDYLMNLKTLLKGILLSAIALIDGSTGAYALIISLENA